MTGRRILLYLILVLVVLGLSDAGYLTFDHYAGTLPPCPLHNSLIDCGRVLRSQYSIVFGIPLALFGLAHYFYLLILTALMIFRNHKLWQTLFLLEATFGLLFSGYFMYLQLFVIKNLCLYCTYSAVVSLLIFVFGWIGLVVRRGQLIE